MKSHCLRLMLVTQPPDSPWEDYLAFVIACVHAGVTSVQLRAKHLSGQAQYQFGVCLKEALNALEVPLIVNDSLELCLTLDAAGLHLGQADGSVVQAREVLGSEKIIGLTVNTLLQIEQANILPVDYIGVGAIYPTSSKPDVEMFWGLEGLGRAVSLSAHPIVAIGGIQEENATAIMQAGAKGIAAIGVFHQSQNPSLTTQNLRKITEG